MSQNNRIHEIITILRKNQVLSGITPEKLTNIFGELGPTFIKLGQVLAMRRDVLPKAYCDQLMKLQTSVNPISYEEVLGVIEEELGDYETIFAEIDTEPLGSASIAQVHRARLKDGREVVVKVQRPGVYETMEQDLRFMKRAAHMINRLASNTSIGVIDLEATIDELWETSKEELNFKTEAKNLKTFKRLNADIDYVDSPGVYDALTTDKILVMDYMPGVDIDDKNKLVEMGYDLDEVAEKLCTNYIKQVISDGFFHADPHPGNIRVDEGKIRWIDLGMTGNLSEHDQKLFHEAMLAVAYNDTEALKSAFLSLGESQGEIDEVQLYTQIDAMLEGATRLYVKSVYPIDAVCW